MDLTNPNSSSASFCQPQDPQPHPKKQLPIDFVFQEGDSEYLREGIRLIQQTGRKPKYPLSGFFLFSEEVKVTLKAQGQHSRSKAATQRIKEIWQKCPRQQDYHRLSSQHYQDYRRLLSYWKLLQSRKPGSTSAAGKFSRLETKPTARTPPQESLLKKRKLPRKGRQGCTPNQWKRQCSAAPSRQDPAHLWISLPCPLTATPSVPIEELDHTQGKVPPQKRSHSALPEPGPSAQLEPTPPRIICHDHQATGACLCSGLQQQFEHIRRHHPLANPTSSESVAQASIDRSLLRGFLASKSPSEANHSAVASLRTELAISLRDHCPYSNLPSNFNPSCRVPGQPKKAQLLSFVPDGFLQPSTEVGRMAVVLPPPAPSLQ